MRDIPRDPVEGGGAIVCQSYDESKLWDAYVATAGDGFVVVVGPRGVENVEETVNFEVLKKNRVRLKLLNFPALLNDAPDIFLTRDTKFYVLPTTETQVTRCPLGTKVICISNVRSCLRLEQEPCRPRNQIQSEQWLHREDWLWAKEHEIHLRKLS